MWLHINRDHYMLKYLYKCITNTAKLFMLANTFLLMCCGSSMCHKKGDPNSYKADIQFKVYHCKTVWYFKTIQS